jgi:hypothetical protein
MCDFISNNIKIQKQYRIDRYIRKILFNLNPFFIETLYFALVRFKFKLLNQFGTYLLELH